MDINTMTVYDLMAEDMGVSVAKNKKFGFNLHIEGERGEALVNAEGIHPFAAESMASFCRQYLMGYERIKQ